MRNLSDFILPGALGLLLGLTLRWTRLCRPDGLRRALALRLCHETRSLLYAVGAFIAMAAGLMWLAVIDVDGIAVLPLSAGALGGGAVFGVAAALAGFTPLTAFAGLGSGRPGQALCTLAGCLAGRLLLPLLSGPLAALQSLPPLSSATLFATTLDEPYLLGGGFLGQACTGLMLMTLAAVIPSNRLVRAAAAASSPASPDAVVLPPVRTLPPIPVRPPSHLRLHAPEPLLRLPAPPESAAGAVSDHDPDQHSIP